MAVNTSEFDREFIDMMVPHHQGALEMARIAQSRAKRQEILDLAQQILSSQDSETTQMRTWRQAWFGNSETPSMSKMPMLSADPSMGAMGHTMDMARDVDELRDAPEPFDRAFIEAIIPHHQSAVDAARLARQQATHPEIQDLALRILEAQQVEIGRMRLWQQSWTYLDAPPPPAVGEVRDVPDEHMQH